MKSISLSFSFVFLFTLSLFAQDKRHFNPIPKAIIGEWKILEPKGDSRFESIIFYPGGFLNIDTKGTKLVINYSVADSAQGYVVSIIGMQETPPFPSFFIKSVKGNNMQITTGNENSSKTFTLIKAKDIPSGIIPLQGK